MNQQVNHEVTDVQQLFAEFLASQGKGLPEAKGGTTRNVFDLGDAVAKVAKDPKGLQQNEEELDPNPQTPQALVKGKDFVITEKAQRDDKTLNQWLKPLREYDSEDFEDKNPNLVALMKNMGLESFLKKKLLWGDFTAARNWGLDKEGKPTLLDKGTLNADIYEHEDAPKNVQKEYGKIKKDRRTTNSINAARSINRGEVIKNA